MKKTTRREAGDEPTISHESRVQSWQYRQARLRDALRVRNAGVVYAFVLLLVALTVLSIARGRPFYLSPQNIVNVLDQSSITMVMVVAMTLLLISGNFDLSVGSIAGLCAAVTVVIADQAGLPVAIAVSLAIGLAIGLLNGSIVQFVGINAFIVTLGTLTGIRGLVLITTDARQVIARTDGAKSGLAAIHDGRWTTPNLLLGAGVIAIAVFTVLWYRQRGSDRQSHVYLWGAGSGAVILIVGILVPWHISLTKPSYYAFGLALGGWLVLRFTSVGRRLYATGGNTEAARLSGIRVARYKVVPFMLNGLAAAFAGILYAGRIGAVEPAAMSGVELTVLAAAILGGTSLFGGSGSLPKSVIGGLILFTLANGFNMLNLGATYQRVFEGIVIVVAASVYTLAERRGATKSTVP